ncbi:hypothetical protein F4559_003389 [Saccharothrix violaceirubra]|uniref:Uncharacterized protein n=1 Tax=Saccharothrix violaceirubra TaxID=413306 RepID=A0A7W7T6B1_9PSEU|nr:hypothetical protein [Saccharothrix violaceirubra]
MPPLAREDSVPRGVYVYVVPPRVDIRFRAS